MSSPQSLSLSEATSTSALSSTRLGRYGRYYIDQFSPYFVPFKSGANNAALGPFYLVFLLYENKTYRTSKSRLKRQLHTVRSHFLNKAI
jgi:hypothetical protein